jgi:ERCC4-type nuclease
MSLKHRKFGVVVDSNEHSRGRAWTFPNYTTHVSSLLRYGCDYSIRGQTGIIGVERKSFSDYVRCLGADFKRFVKQCRKLQRNRYYCIIVEGNVDNPIPIQSRMIVDSVVTQTAKVVSMGIPVIFAGTRTKAQLMCIRYLTFAYKAMRDGD